MTGLETFFSILLFHLIKSKNLCAQLQIILFFQNNYSNCEKDQKLKSVSTLLTQIGLRIPQKYDFQFFSLFLTYLLHVLLFSAPLSWYM
jgi:hypothetical protein